jgi:non-heme Fe2+,alpha-ketoglutarate-dependent halogenase
MYVFSQPPREEDSEFGGRIIVWAAFSEATVDNGCLQFIPGSHPI